MPLKDLRKVHEFELSTRKGEKIYLWDELTAEQADERTEIMMESSRTKYNTDPTGKKVEGFEITDVKDPKKLATAEMYMQFLHIKDWELKDENDEKADLNFDNFQSLTVEERNELVEEILRLKTKRLKAQKKPSQK